MAVSSISRTNLLFQGTYAAMPPTFSGRREKRKADDLLDSQPTHGLGARDSTAAVTTVTVTGQEPRSSSARHAPSSSAQETRLIATQRKPVPVIAPNWHAPWELDTVISGHLGWVRSIAFDPSNDFFATGSADRTIKIWDLAKCCAGAEGGLKLTLTGHIHTVRGLAFSPRHPYLFSAGEDKLVKCWDMEYNKVVRHYHGHLSGVFCLALHPTLDVLITGGRDSVARVWDMRTKNQVHVLCGHEGTVGSLLTHSADPQVISGSHDCTIKLWDLAKGSALSTLTHHKKSVRSLVASKREFVFYSGGADNIKKWRARDGMFLQNLSGHSSALNALALNDDGVLVSGGDDGSLRFWDAHSGYCFQQTQTIVQPGSLDAEAGIYAAAFDLSGSRLITCEADKSLKVWKENAAASETSHPIDSKAWAVQQRALKRH